MGGLMQETDYMDNARAAVDEHTTFRDDGGRETATTCQEVYITRWGM
jgi:hypothetical protein